jgi:hypothetical protein
MNSLAWTSISVKKTVENAIIFKQYSVGESSTLNFKIITNQHVKIDIL